jgi:hypothetical protein
MMMSPGRACSAMMTAWPTRIPDTHPTQLLRRLVGFRLGSVQFAMDYVQLHFDGHAQDMPTVRHR